MIKLKILRWGDYLGLSKQTGFICGSAGKESACNAGDLGLIPGLGRPPRERKGYPLQYSGLGNSMDCVVCGSQSQTRLSDFLFHFSSKCTVYVVGSIFIRDKKHDI